MAEDEYHLFVCHPVVLSKITAIYHIQYFRVISLVYFLIKKIIIKIKIELTIKSSLIKLSKTILNYIAFKKVFLKTKLAMEKDTHP